MANLTYKQESYELIGVLFDVHNELGGGFLEAVYSDAIEYELKARNIPFEREKRYQVNYKEVVLPHQYVADFVIYDKIILEIKSVATLNDRHIAQCINYLKVSGNKLAILVNFEPDKLMHQRIVL
ncbi:GxxExxY protein [Christiangramia sabulilitoris]|uniref:GxxExxY protein n=1 Tax=Christiangramia sabulilitoris TaxID=2583991 RepID=A0A550I852_9FLAO|nr:GxxExxY protein [Christiangramia sabulilitoris]TRO67157.1 GxxExxY protein [Christiangramia sabulilitoris]